MKQHTDEWFAEKAGKIGASSIYKIMAGGKGLTRKKYIYKLALERVTGCYITDYQCADMDRGNELEAEVRQAYEERMLTPVIEVGWIPHPTIPNTGASPDGLVGEDGLVEIKTRAYHIQIDFFNDGKIPGECMKQTQWQMSCTGRNWCDYVSYMDEPEEIKDKISDELQMKIVRVKRNPAQIKEIAEAVKHGLADVEELAERLSKKGMINELRGTE